MICPRCGDELRRSKKDPTFGLCDNCRKKYKWIEEEIEEEFDDELDDDYYDDEDEDDDEIILDDDDDEIDEDLEESRRLTKRTPQSPPVKKKKRKGLIIFLVILVLVIAGGTAAFFLLGGPERFNLFNKPEETEDVRQEDNTDTNNGTDEAGLDADNAADTNNNQSYSSGTYVVGTDIPAGEYLLLADMAGYFERAADTTGEIESIHANGNFSTNSIVTISEGEYFIFSGATAYPIDQAPAYDISQQGMYKVGTDFPAGDYTIQANGVGTVEIAIDSTHNAESIISKEEFEGEKAISLADGQYVILTEASIML